MLKILGGIGYVDRTIIGLNPSLVGFTVRHMMDSLSAHPLIYRVRMPGWFSSVL